MTNPFYIPPRQRKSPFMDVANMGLKLHELKQGAELAKQEKEYQQKTSDWRQGQVEATAAHRTKMFDETVRHNKATEAQNKKHMALTPIPEGRAKTIAAQIKMLGEGAGIKKTAIEPVVDYFTELQQAGGSPDAIWRVFKRNLGQISAPIVEDLTGQLEKLVKDTQNIPGEAPKAKIEKLENLITAMKDPDFTDALFPTASAYDAQRIEAENRLQERALELAKARTKAAKAYGDPYLDQFGNLVQKETPTGKISKVSAPQRGMRIQSGDTTIETGIIPGQGGKILPAGQVEKIGEFGAYISTMDEIQGMVDAGEIDSAGFTAIDLLTKKTGPLEFIRKRVDNWGILPNEKRIELRALVARLPGLMYAMRGKQLSNKELKVALDMIPQMDLADDAFKIQLKKFNQYIGQILKGKKKAFGGAGYDTGAFKDIKGLGDDELLKRLAK